MADLSPIFNGFNSGEISPRMKARTDLDKYATAAGLIENFIILPEGGLLRRSGTRYVGTLSDQTKKARLVPFIFSTDDAYILAFENNLIRIYTNGAIVAATVVTTYTEAQIPLLRFEQSGDFLYIAHQQHHPAILKRVSALNWTLTAVPFEAGPWQEKNREEDWTLSHNVKTGAVTVTASEDTFTAFDDDGQGRMLRIAKDIFEPPDADAKWGWGVCTTFTSATSAVFNVDTAHPFKQNNAAPWSDWQLGAFSSDPTIGYPASVALFEGRLCWAGTVAQPDTVWGSETSIYNSHLPFSIADQTVIDSHSINFTLASGSMNTILWMHPLRSLIMGSSGGISSIAGSSDSGLSPNNVKAQSITNFGAAAIDPALVGSTLCYLTRFGNKLIGLQFSFTDDSFTPSNLTVVSEHILGDGGVQIAYAQSPNSVVYVPRVDGQIATLTLIPDQNIFGWSRQILGGSFGSGAPVVESVETIPSPDETHDQTWVIVKRTINGATKRYIELFEEDFDEETQIEDAFFVDSGITYDGASTTTITGLTHLDGETVQVLADGAVHPDCVVSAGSVELSYSASKVHVGLGYDSNLETLNPEVRVPGGTMQGKPNRVVGLSLRLHSTVGGKVGRDADSLDPLPGRSPGDPLGEPVQPITQDVHRVFGGTYTDNATIYVRQDQPLPMTVLGIMPELASGSRQ